MSKYSTEMFLRVYNDNDGTFIQVAHDPDSIDMVVISYQDPRDTRVRTEIFMDIEQAQLVQEALGKFLWEVSVSEKKVSLPEKPASNLKSNIRYTCVGVNPYNYVHAIRIIEILTGQIFPLAEGIVKNISDEDPWYYNPNRIMATNDDKAKENQAYLNNYWESTFVWHDGPPPCPVVYDPTYENEPTDPIYICTDIYSMNKAEAIKIIQMLSNNSRPWAEVIINELSPDKPWIYNPKLMNYGDNGLGTKEDQAFLNNYWKHTFIWKDGINPPCPQVYNPKKDK